PDVSRRRMRSSGSPGVRRSRIVRRGAARGAFPASGRHHLPLRRARPSFRPAGEQPRGLAPTRGWTHGTGRGLRT
ncbi:MAG: hypothetical protein ACREQ5_27420, partial [Candidatus Dormibacteria bacterium]